MITAFERIPDLFVQLYDQQFQVWAREFRKRGPKCAIEFQRPRGKPVLLDAGGRPIQAGAWLVAEVDRANPDLPKVIIRPASEQDEELIARHCREMRGEVLH